MILGPGAARVAWVGRVGVLCSRQTSSGSTCSVRRPRLRFEGVGDVDLLVDFGELNGRAEAHAFFSLQDDLRAVFGTDVDVVMVAAVENRYLARDIERSRLLLCAAQRC